MGKYMWKRKGVRPRLTGAMDATQQGSMGVRTRARTLALEQDRKLALAQSASEEQEKEKRRGEQAQEEEEAAPAAVAMEMERRAVQAEAGAEEEHAALLPEEEQAQPPTPTQRQPQPQPKAQQKLKQKQAAEPSPPNSNSYSLRSRKTDKEKDKDKAVVVADRDINVRRRGSTSTPTPHGRIAGEDSSGAKLKESRYSRMRPAEAAAAASRNANSADPEAEAVAVPAHEGGRSGLRNARTPGSSRSSGSAAKASLPTTGTKRKANTRSNARSKVAKAALEEQVVGMPPAAASASVVADAITSAAAAEVPSPPCLPPPSAILPSASASGKLNSESNRMARNSGSSPTSRHVLVQDAADPSEFPNPKSLEVEVSFGDNAFGDSAMELDRFSAKDSEISRPSTRSSLRNVRESTPSSYSRDQDCDTPEACSRLPTPQDGGWRPSRRRRLFEAPTASELDDFFSVAEGRDHQRFAERYNFDPVNDVPLPGRFEWEKVEEEKPAAGTAGPTAPESGVATPVLPRQPGA